MSVIRWPYVPGEGPKGRAPIMFVGESPGFYESQHGAPFHRRSASGRFLRTIAPKTRVPLGDAWITNLCKVRTVDKHGKDRPPTKGEIRSYESDLRGEIRKHDPEIIVGLGATASRWLLGAAWEDLETLHGLPHRVGFEGRERIVIASYHPAAGLHSPEMAAYFFYDMLVVGRVIAGHEVPFRKRDGECDYRVQHGADVGHARLSKLGGSDTEGSRWVPWCLQISTAKGEARLIRADDVDGLVWFFEQINEHGMRVVLHSAAHDLNVYRELATIAALRSPRWRERWAIGVPDSAFEDTAIRAYVLQIEPRGLKPLATRHCGMEMSSYAEIVKPHDRRVAINYLESVLRDGQSWPAGIGRKHGIARRVQSIIAATNKPRTTKTAPKGPRARWEDIDKPLRAPVEAALGKMPALRLDDCGPEFIAYAARDADATRRLEYVLEPMVETMGLGDVYRLDRDVTPMLARMMHVGMRVDREKLGAFESELRRELREILYRARDLADEPMLNPASPPQVADLLFRKLKLIPKRFTDGGLPSTNDQVLRALLDAHPVVHWVTEYREVQKLLGFVEKLWYEIEERGAVGNDRYYPILRGTTVVTGRLSAEGLNVLALPTHSKRAKAFKACFVADEGCVLVSCDLDQIEFKIAADESGDEAMLDVFRRGVDMHTTTASKVFGIPYDEVTRTEENATRYRTPAKITGFRVLYQGGAEGLLQQLDSLGIKGYGLADCERFIRGFYETYPRWGAYIEQCNMQTRRRGYIRARGGRLRYLPAIWAEDRYLRRKAERDAGNFPIQAGAQWVIKRAMCRLWPTLKELRASGLPVDVLLQIHDDLLTQVPVRHARFVAELVREAMCADSSEFKVPITASLKFGTSWGSMQKEKDWKGEGKGVAA